MKNQKCPFTKGVDLKARDYGIIAMQIFCKAIESVRRQFIEDTKDTSNFQGEVHVGTRVMDNEKVLSVLKSNVTEQDFLISPLTDIYYALHACAEMDWWYFAEKEWEDKASILESEGM